MHRVIRYLCLQAPVEGQAPHTHVHGIVDGLRKIGFTVELYATEDVGNKGFFGIVARLIQSVKVQWGLMRSAQPVDVLYIRSHFAALPVALWARMKGIPVIQEVNGPYEDLFIAWSWTRHFGVFFAWMIRKQLEWAQEVIAVTPMLAEWVTRETGRERTWVVPNGVDVELFRPGVPGKSWFRGEPYVLFFGNLAPWQGIDVMLQAVKETDWPKQVKLVIAGDGTGRARVVEESSKGEHVLYLGSIFHQELPGLIVNCLCTLSCQTNVGGRASTGLYPLKVMESLACGVPVIVSDFSGQGDLVRKFECGVVIPPNDSKALAKAVQMLFQEQRTRIEMGIRGRAAAALMSWDTLAKETASVISQAIEVAGS